MVVGLPWFHIDVPESDANGKDETIDQTMPNVPKNPTSPSSVGSNSYRRGRAESKVPVVTTNGSKLGLSQPDLGFSNGFDGSSLVAHTFVNDDSNTSLYPPSKKTRLNFEEIWFHMKNNLDAKVCLLYQNLWPPLLLSFSEFIGSFIG